MPKKEIENFIESVEGLIKLNNRITALMFSLKTNLQICREAKIPIFGNPINNIYNDTVILNYRSLQLRDNCQVYKDLIDNDIFIDPLFLLQLNGMLIQIEEMHHIYKIMNHRFDDCRYQVYSTYDAIQFKPSSAMG